jgi:hypothetical protein
MAKKAAESKSSSEVVAEKSGPDAKPDGKFRKTFNVQVTPFTQLSDVQGDDVMHEANKLATLQEALNRGVHPKGEPELESTEVGEEHLNSATVKFTYAVEAVAAFADLDAPGTTTPAEMLKVEEHRTARKRAAADPEGFAE